MENVENVEKTENTAVKKESAFSWFMKEKPILYAVVLMTVLAIICGAVLGVAGMFLRVESDALTLEARELAILQDIMPSAGDNYEIIDYKDENVYDKTLVKDYRIKKVVLAKGAPNEGCIAVKAEAVSDYMGGFLETIVAFDNDGKVLGLRVYTLKADSKQTYDQGFRQDYWNGFTGKTAKQLADRGSTNEDLKTLGLWSDTFTQASATPRSILQGAVNAAKFYQKYGEVIRGGELKTDKTVEAIRGLYPSMPDAPDYEDYRKPVEGYDNITVYVINRVPFVRVAVPDSEEFVVLYFINLAGAVAEVKCISAATSAEVTDDEIESAEIAGKEFWAAKSGIYVKLESADTDIYDKIMAKHDAGTAYEYEPLLNSKFSTAADRYGKEYNAAIKKGSADVFRIVKAVPVGGGNDFYIVAGSARSYSGSLFSFTLIEETAVGEYFVREVLTFPDHNNEHYLEYYVYMGAADKDFYKYLAKFSAAITADNYKAFGFDDRADAEKQIIDEEDTHATMSYDGIVNGVLMAIKNLRETLPII